ncbi:hypothetical protein Q9295_09870 [Xinfangfangia sp. CPCC 101601]|uniref:Uncharacterized protein n=1 Tax=Pseudogemmobacter lacusdianii TaxID=3069608 RepID=A0ABU0VYH9_9RHOB|nr:hypothetical protein [Xinfangfangia sp. CPCC 101601]MDQ2066683.1 hypothetical protein [Xinfangfangia sp. CPCC 101601]
MRLKSFLTRPVLAGFVALNLGFAALPARADLVIQGRAAQALHCSAMLYMVSEQLYNAGYMNRSELNWAQGAAVKMLDYVPGTDDQKVAAMGQRFDKISRTRSLEGLMQEYNDTSTWCQKHFL